MQQIKEILINYRDGVLKGATRIKTGDASGATAKRIRNLAYGIRTRLATKAHKRAQALGHFYEPRLEELQFLIDSSDLVIRPRPTAPSDFFLVEVEQPQ